MIRLDLRIVARLCRRRGSLHASGRFDRSNNVDAFFMNRECILSGESAIWRYLYDPFDALRRISPILRRPRFPIRTAGARHARSAIAESIDARDDVAGLNGAWARACAVSAAQREAGDAGEGVDEIARVGRVGAADARYPSRRGRRQ